jgi:(1->4)-alpha-D-glucan 1-alpha-D-glucosylmutase
MRHPVSTYRLQLRGGLGLREATLAVEYLHALGITDVYLSPIALARDGSTHGYDVCDPNLLDPALGTPADFETFLAALAARGMGLLLDIVPNHMATDAGRNPWWHEVLARGAEAPAARVFDIDWHPGKAELTGKILLPILNRPYGLALEAGELRVMADGAGRHLQVGGQALPLATGVGPDPAEINGRAGDPASFDPLHALLERQYYRLADWRTASDEVNYRRFFNIDHLVGVRVEDPWVFAETHRWVAALIRRGAVTGLRIDHPDGLSEPGAYLERLQRLAPPEGAGESGEPALYVVVEKILVKDERLPEAWAVQGTTGYDFLNTVNGVFVARHRVRTLERIYSRFVGRRPPFAETEYVARKQVMETTLTSELDRLAGLLNQLSERDRRTRDFTLHSLRRALLEIVACMPVYRTYVNTGGCRAEDRAWIGEAVRRADRRNPGLESSLLQFVGEMIVTAPADPERLVFARRWQQFTGPVFAKAVEDMAFYRDNTLVSLNEVGGDPAHPGTGIAEFHASNAERLERVPHGLLATTTHDTKFSEDVRARLNVLSERDRDWQRHLQHWRRLNTHHRTRAAMGAAPDRHDEFRFYQLLLAIWPPDATSAPESLVERLCAAMIKSAREASVHTSWVRPDADYETALTTFIRRALSEGTATFVRSLSSFARSIAQAGVVNSLAQLVLKVAAPGVPDFYQGTELWSLRLTDPDNRGLVDLELRRDLLARIDDRLRAPGVDRPALIASYLETWPNGMIKMLLTATLLRFRRRRAALFATGDYLPLTADLGPSMERPQVVAFARQRGAESVVAIVPRFSAAVIAQGTWPIGPDVWGEASVRLPEAITARRFVDVCTDRPVAASPDGRLPLGVVLAHCPVALLATESAHAPSAR